MLQPVVPTGTIAWGPVKAKPPPSPTMDRDQEETADGGVILMEEDTVPSFTVNKAYASRFQKRHEAIERSKCESSLPPIVNAFIAPTNDDARH